MTSVEVAEVLTLVGAVLGLAALIGMVVAIGNIR